MTKEQFLQLLAAQKLAASTIRTIGKEIIDTIELALIGDMEALEKLKLMNTRGHGVLTTFFKVSSLLMKLFPIEHSIAGTELIKNLESLDSEDKLEQVKITEADIQAMKQYVERYEREKNQVH